MLFLDKLIADVQLFTLDLTVSIATSSRWRRTIRVRELAQYFLSNSGICENCHLQLGKTPPSD